MIFLLLAAAGAVAAASIALLRPLLVRYALARPNARSLHVAPTPQGGGVAVVGAALLAACASLAVAGIDDLDAGRLGLVAGASVAMALLGFVDDVAPLPALPRLVAQLAAVAAVVAALPEGARVLPILPEAVERVLLILGGAWFVNLVNFMDGMDWMTVVEMVPLLTALILFWHWGLVSGTAGVLAVGLCGGLVGFAPFNAPVARLFLGDVGSLPIGLVVAFCLFDLASHGGLAAAILLPLYYIFDSGLTLAWRLRRGERVWEAHRQHFYQVAVARGLAVRAVLARVAAANVALAGLAALSLGRGAGAASACVAVGGVVVGGLLRSLARGRSAEPGRA